jgi:hypothetical protein
MQPRPLSKMPHQLNKLRLVAQVSQPHKNFNLLLEIYKECEQN